MASDDVVGAAGKAGVLVVLAAVALSPAWGEPRSRGGMGDLRGTRIEVRGSVLLADGRPVYLAGVWVGGTVSTDPRLHKPELDGDHPAYAALLSAATAPGLGITSVHPPMSALRVMQDTGWFAAVDAREQGRWDGLQSFVRGLAGLPVTVDCAHAKAFGAARVPAELKQVGPGWHGFVPLCPEHPDGIRIYTEYWRDCARQVAEAGSNAFCYELFNEPAYNCRCERNRRDFAARMQTRYGAIEAANAVWGTRFGGYDELAATPEVDATSGLWCDWTKFLGDRYVEILSAGRDAIRQVDTREPLYFVDQPSVSHTYLRCNGIDPVKVNALMDSVGMEGGVLFGALQPTETRDPMAAVLTPKGLFSHQLYLDMARAFGKPVLNTETYCGRFYNNVRFPSHREDIVTELWAELIHGAVGSYFYNWGRRWWEWRDLAGAKRAAREVGYKAFSMLNPYAWPKDALNGFQDFQRDMELVGEELLAGPRIEGQVALLISQPTIRQLYRRMGYGDRGPYEALVRTWYAALLLSHVPVDVLWEEQLPDADLARYSAVLAPLVTYCYAASAPRLRHYVAQGGQLITTPGSFEHDEYGRSGLTEVPATSIEAHLTGEELQARLADVLFGAADFRAFRLLPADGSAEPLLCEAYRLVRAAGNYYYMVNWDTISRLVRLCIPDPAGDKVTAPLTGTRHVGGDLASTGVLVHLPSQSRVLLRVAGVADAAQPVTEAHVRQAYEQALAGERRELRLVAAELADARQVAEGLRVNCGGDVDDTGQYLLDPQTVMLLHFNGSVDGEPDLATGAITFTTGKFGTDAVRVGEGCVLRFGVPPDFDSSIGSLELWARPDWPPADGLRHTLVDMKGPGEWNQNRLMLYKNKNYEVGFAIYGRDKKALAARVPINILRQNGWTHLCATWDASAGLVLYVNGEKRAAVEGRVPLEPFDRLFVGSTGTDRFWQGSIDELRLSSVQREPDMQAQRK